MWKKGVWTCSAPPWDTIPPPISVPVQLGGELLTVQVKLGLRPAAVTCVCGQLGEEVCGILLMEALTLDQIAHSVLGAAVRVVGAADGLGGGGGRSL